VPRSNQMIALAFFLTFLVLVLALGLWHWPWEKFAILDRNHQFISKTMVNGSRHG